MTVATEDHLFTQIIHGGLEPDPSTGAILTPIHQSTTYVQNAVGDHRGFTYSRSGNPTVAALERNLGAIEESLPAACFSSGMAAITALFLATLRSGDHAIVSDVVYGGTVRLYQEILCGLGIDVSFVDTSRREEVEDALTSRTRLILIETPANPTLKLTDIASVAQLARDASIRLAVDNTFLTPVLQRPLDLGADVSLYSTTKFIEGHNATVGGAIVTRDESLLSRIRVISKTVGFAQSPQEAWLTLRGLKTLPLRMKRHSQNATQVASWLEGDSRVARVFFPGLDSFEQRELAQAQQKDWGGILAFELKDGADAGRRFMASVRLCSLAENLGAVETLITHPVSMTHGDVPLEKRRAVGITDGLIRLSVGLEDPQDIIDDLRRALDVACRPQ